MIPTSAADAASARLPLGTPERREDVSGTALRRGHPNHPCRASKRVLLLHTVRVSRTIDRGRGGWTVRSTPGNGLRWRPEGGTPCVYEAVVVSTRRLPGSMKATSAARLGSCDPRGRRARGAGVRRLEDDGRAEVDPTWAVSRGAGGVGGWRTMIARRLDVSDPRGRASASCAAHEGATDCRSPPRDQPVRQIERRVRPRAR